MSRSARVGGLHDPRRRQCPSAKGCQPPKYATSHAHAQRGAASSHKADGEFPRNTTSSYKQRNRSSRSAPTKTSTRRRWRRGMHGSRTPPAGAIVAPHPAGERGIPRDDRSKPRDRPAAACQPSYRAKHGKGPRPGPSTGEGHVLGQSKRSTNPLETAAASRTKDGDGD